MSTSYNAVVMVGLPYDELSSWLGDTELNEKIDDDELQVGSYGYDSLRRSNIVGYTVIEAGHYTEIDRNAMGEILTMLEEFHKTYGIEGKVYLTMFVY